MKNIFIQMAASAGHAVAYTIGPIFKHIIECVQLYFTNGFTNIVLYSVICLWIDCVDYCMASRGNHMKEIIVHY